MTNQLQICLLLVVLVPGSIGITTRLSKNVCAVVNSLEGSFAQTQSFIVILSHYHLCIISL